MPITLSASDPTPDLRPFRVISLGWGVQSFTLAAMSALGELDPVDAAIHADTTHEASGTYAFAREWMLWMEELGVSVVTVKSGNPVIDIIRTGGMIYIPAFTRSLRKRDGMLRRQCTNRWKIQPIRRWLQANRAGKPVEMWMGITTDEASRMRDSDVKYIRNIYPLIDKGMSRHDCVKWLQAHILPVPPKSACVFCPFHDTRAWRDLKKMSGNGDWKKAIEVDEQIRKVRPPYELFLHPSRIPLEDVDISTAEERGQLNLWNNECAGVCGV